MSKFKAGDRARVVKEIHGHDFAIGDNVTIESIDPAIPRYKCYDDKRSEWWYLDDEELELINIDNSDTSTLITTILSEVSSRANQEYPELRILLDQLVIAARIEALDEAISNINQIKQR